MKRAVLHATLVTIVSGTTLTTADALTAEATTTAVADCHGKRATIVGTARSEVIHGTAGPDVIAGLAGNDTIDGGGGNDLICGDAGTDHLNGGPGDDRLFGGADGVIVTDEETDRIGDSLRGGAGNDYLNGGPRADTRPAYEIVPDAYLFDDSPRAVTVDVAGGTARGDGFDRFAGHHVAILGSRYGDRINGGAGADYLNGGPGPDVIYGHKGRDRLIGDSGRTVGNSNDVLYGGSGNDDMSATAGVDTFHGGPGNDVMDDIGNSADVVYGDQGNDLIIDELSAKGHTATLSGGSGLDHLSILTSILNPLPEPATGSWNMRTGTLAYTLTSTLHATAKGFEDADLAAWGTKWTIDGTAGPNTLIAGGSAGTTFYGRAGDDRFLGSTYSDVFNGGPGHDRSLGMGYDDNDTCISVESFASPDCDHIDPE